MPKRHGSELKLLSILDSLPCVNTQLNNILQNYHRFKHSSTFSAIALWFFEAMLVLWWNLGLLVLFFVPTELLVSAPVKLADEFICHQLVFLEERLSKKTGTEYKSINGIFRRGFKLLSLIFRLLFIWPRITISLAVASWSVICDEFQADFKLLKEIFSKTSIRARRTTRKVAKKGQSSSPLARKRKHEDNIEDKIEQYLFVNESYRSENDPDYEIGETTCDFDESCGESEKEDEENIDPNGFLCKECKEDCDEKCNEKVESDCEDDVNDSGEESEDTTSEGDEECEEEKGKEDVIRNDGIEEIRSITTEINTQVLKGGGHHLAPKSPICQKG